MDPSHNALVGAVCMLGSRLLLWPATEARGDEDEPCSFCAGVAGALVVFPNPIRTVIDPEDLVSICPCKRLRTSSFAMIASCTVTKLGTSIDGFNQTRGEDRKLKSENCSLDKGTLLLKQQTDGLNLAIQAEALQQILTRDARVNVANPQRPRRLTWRRCS